MLIYVDFTNTTTAVTRTALTAYNPVSSDMVLKKYQPQYDQDLICIRYQQLRDVHLFTSLEQWNMISPATIDRYHATSLR